MADNADDGGKTNGATGAALEKTFMTSLQARGADAKSLQASIHEPEAMSRVKDLHGKIGSVVNHLNEKIALVLQKQEKEFLAAYRAHMLSVQKELQQLRAKANEAELAMKKNEKIRSLEDERNWYRKEALRLDKFATAMKKDLKYMKEKLESIEDDRKWLERQLKSSKKSNKLLRAELEIRMMQGEAGGEADEFGALEGEGDAGATLGSTADRSEREPMFPPPHGNRGPMHATGPGSPGGGRGKSSRRNKRGLGVSLSKSGSDFHALDPADDDTTTAQYRALVERLESQLQSERRMVKQLRAHAVATSSQRSELEGFFVKCIADIKKDVSRRRTKANQRSAKTRPGAASPAASGRFDRDFGDTAGSRADSPTLDDFTATDRRKVIRRLLSDDYVLQMLHQMIFGPAEETDITAGPPKNAGDTFTGPTGGGEGAGGGVPRYADEGAGGGASEAVGISPDGGLALDPAVEDYLYGGGAGN